MPHSHPRQCAHPLDAQPTKADLIRSAVLGTSTAALVLVPTLGPVLLRTEEGAEEFDTEITPPDYAFVIWAPIFAASAANAVQQAMPANRVSPVNRQSAWWLSAANVTNAAWSVAAQTGRFRWTALILPVATGFAAQAYRRIQHEYPSDAQRIAPYSTGLLLGWTSLASVINLFAVMREGPFASGTRLGRAASVLALITASSAVSAAVATSDRGYVALGGASFWGLATSALNTKRAGSVRLASAVGALLAAGTTTRQALWPGRTSVQLKNSTP